MKVYIARQVACVFKKIGWQVVDLR